MSSFDYEFDKVVYKKKKEKQQKKELFERNVKDHVVYIDEQGKLYKKNKNETHDDEVGLKLVCFIIVVIMILMVLK